MDHKPLRAAGPDGTPHAVTDNHTIYYTIVWNGSGTPPPPPPPVTVRVLEAPWTGTAVFSLLDLYTLNVEKNLDLENGSKLVVKFYTYGDAFENENVIESFVPPAHVEENENARHPEGIGVKKARLDLTTDNTEDVISTIASFTVTWNILYNEIAKEYIFWPIVPPPERDRIIREIMDKYLQWPFAPF